MKRLIMTLVAVLVSVAAATASAGKGEKDQGRPHDSRYEKEIINQVYEVGARARLSLSNLNGAATISGWDKNRIEVTATKRARTRAGLDEATIHFELENDHLRIDVEYEDGDDWRGHGDAVEVEFEIRVPRGARIDHVKLVNGNVDVDNVAGDVDASSVNGAVTGARLGGAVQLATVNGDVALTDLSGDAPISLKSVNGSVSIVVPRGLSARISANTVHGEVRGEIARGVKHAGSSMDAVLGSGGRRIQLGTVNGDIKVRRAPGSDSRDDDRGDSDDDSE